jgi:hypothetical protein
MEDMVVRLVRAQTRRRSWRSLDSSLGYLGCPHPAEAGGVGRGAAAELQVLTLEEFLEVYDGYIGGKYLRGVGVPERH